VYRSLARAVAIASTIFALSAASAAQVPHAVAGRRSVLLSPHGNGEIAFSATRTGNQEIYGMSPDGSGQIDLSDATSSDTLPAWSPDGAKIAFVSDRTGNNEIFVMNADGSGQTNISHRMARDTQPAWSPDGAKIAFVSDRTGNNEIFVMNADGSGQTNISKNAAADSFPAWSPDGAKIAFVSDRTGNNEIFVMNPDGSGPVDLSNASGADTQPAWAPDGTKIAFVSDRAGNNEIFVMNADGSGQTNLSNNAAPDTEPAFSPDQGSRMLFTTKRGGNNEVYVMDALDGSDQVNLSHDHGGDASPAWQPLPASPANGSPVQHVVIIDMENHTFDNVLGKLCAANGRCDGATTGKIKDGSIIGLGPATDIVPVVQHEPSAQIAAIDGGLMDGFSLIAGCTVDTGYACYTQFDQPQIPNLWSLADTFAVSDRTFQQDSIATWGSHLELVTSWLNGFDNLSPYGQSGPGWGCDSGDNAGWHPTPWQLAVPEPSCIPAMDGSGPYRPSPVPWVPTIMDRMDTAGLSWRIYGGVPFEQGLGYHLSICPSFAECLYGPQRPNFVQRDQYLTDAAAGTLPTLSIITPAEVGSQHNNDSMLAGDNWIAAEVGAAMNGPDWDSTVVFITYDDCGCFYDHVPPPAGLGIRMPMVIVSPFAKPEYTDSNVASFDSMLAFVEHTFGLAPLSSRDAVAYDYSQSFDYSQRPIPPIHMQQNPVPAWEIEWIRAHPPDPNDPT
jgi:phospholipase C